MENSDLDKIISTHSDNIAKENVGDQKRYAFVLIMVDTEGDEIIHTSNITPSGQLQILQEAIKRAQEAKEQIY